MSRVRYTVMATFNDKGNIPEFVAWLRNGHCAGVIEGGALSAEASIVEMESEGGKVDITYVFNSREELQGYFDGPAAALRIEGKIKYIDTGIATFERKISEIVYAS